jgi:hypothetical protein
MFKQIKTIAAASLLLVATASKAQLTISSGAVFNIQSGAFVTVQGDVTSSADITGAGKVILKGSANQNVNMNGFVIPNLEMDNAANATLTGNTKITNSVLFTNGKILVGNNTATLAAATTATGMGVSKFFETNGTGFVRRELAADISNAEMPVGAGSDYLPVALTNTGSAYASASIGVQAKGTSSTNKHVRTETFLLAKWPIDKVGITGGTTNAVGTYVDPTGVIVGVGGTEADLRGIFWNGTNWSLTGGSQSTVANTVGADIASNTGELYGMNKFLLFDSKVFLQGTGLGTGINAGLMNDLLRNSTSPTYATYTVGVTPVSNLLPTSDPYSTNAQYSPNTNFTRVANTLTEIVTATAFNDQVIPADNIVDWVFLELRNAATPGVVAQTRSALLQRDGDVVDIDGVSPIYFKNVDAGNYVISVKHRNHLAMSMNVANYTQALGLVKNTQFDFSTTAPSNLLGTVGLNYFNGSSKNMLYAGNVNGNSNVKFQGPLNDRVTLLSDLGSESATPTGYLRGDLNMNRISRYQGPSNDRVYILSTILGNNESLIINQVLPL